MPSSRYPHLAQMLGAYFHQDCYMDGASDAEILDDFRAAKPASYVAATVKEIDRFLAAHPHGLLAALEATFAPDVTLGEDDDEACAWLMAATKRLSG